MAVSKYYEDELSYLREQGAEFARANPSLSNFLSREVVDPDVERLLEGFSFLVARLRERLDQDMPEVVQGLMRLLWPHYLRPVPPITTLAFAPSPSSQTVTRVPKGVTVNSRPVDDVSCAFTTRYAVEVVPFAVQRLELENRSASARLTIGIDAVGQATTAALATDRLRLFFNAEREPTVARSLLLWMLRYVRRITVSSDGTPAVELGPDAVRPVGFSPDETVLAGTPNHFAGFRLLQEYLAYPAKFLYVDIFGIASLAQRSDHSITLAIEFERQLPDQVRLVDGNIRLNCTPAVNLFRHDAHPIRLTGRAIEHRVRPSGGRAFAVHGVETVTGFLQGKAGRREYAAFESFRHELPGAGADRLYFRESIRPSVTGRGIDHFVSFVDRNNVTEVPDVEVLSIALLASNGPVADRLGIGTIDLATPEVPNTVVVNNVASVVSEVQPPIADALLWRLMSSLARNFGPMTDIGALRSVIASYDFRAVQDVQARRRLELMLAGLTDLRSTPEDAVVRGVPARLRRIVIDAAESQIGGEGELFLLGSVLDAFFSSYATVNHLHALTMHGTETNVSYAWAPRAGIAAAL
jgi:type VI secretion system protein ImpG